MTDFTISYRAGSTLGQLTPENDSAKSWLDDNVQSEPYQWLGKSLCIEPRYIENLMAGIEDAGYTIDFVT